MENKKVKFPIAAVLFAIAEILGLVWIVENFAGWIIFPTNIIGFAINVFLCFVLFIKRTDILLITAIVLKVLWSVVFFDLFNILIWLSILVMAIISFAPFKNGLDKYNPVVKKFIFIPILLDLISFGLSAGKVYEENHHSVASISYSISWSLGFVAVIMLCIWVAYPYVSETATNEYSADGCTDEAYSSLGKHIVLLLFTFGIWSLIWVYRTTKFLNKAPGAEQYNPTNKLLLCMFVPFYQIYWLYKHGQRIDNFSRAKKLNNSDMATMCLILGIFIPIVAFIIMQDRINAICTAKAVPASNEAVPSADELKKYKELLDSGVITQEEFDAKKKQLLGL